jgi:hypothetical protein
MPSSQTNRTRTPEIFQHFPPELTRRDSPSQMAVYLDLWVGSSAVVEDKV